MNQIESINRHFDTHAPRSGSQLCHYRCRHKWWLNLRRGIALYSLHKTDTGKLHGMSFPGIWLHTLSANTIIRRSQMQTNAPKLVVWVVAVIIGSIGILSHVLEIPAARPYAFWLVAIGFVVLALANVLKQL